MCIRLETMTVVHSLHPLYTPVLPLKQVSKPLICFNSRVELFFWRCNFGILFNVSNRPLLERKKNFFRRLHFPWIFIKRSLFCVVDFLGRRLPPTLPSSDYTMCIKSSCLHYFLAFVSILIDIWPYFATLHMSIPLLGQTLVSFSFCCESRANQQGKHHDKRLSHKVRKSNYSLFRFDSDRYMDGEHLKSVRK